MYSKLRIVLIVIALLSAVAGVGRYFHRPASAQIDSGIKVVGLDDQFVTVAQLVPSFGGLFVGADGRVNIYLLNTEHLAAAQQAVTAVFGRNRLPLENAVALPARYNFLQLKGWHDRHRTATLALQGVISADIDERSNLLKIGVRDVAAAAEVRAKLSELGIPTEAVAIVERAPFETHQTLQDAWRPATGGTQISSTNGTCTSSFLAVRSNQAGIVTNSHCTAVFGSVDGTVMHQANVVAGNLERVGIETFDAALFTGGQCPSGRQCRFSDAAFIKRDGSSDQSIPLMNDAFGYIRIAKDPTAGLVTKHKIVAKANASFVGEWVEKSGRTTGHTTGDIDATCVDVNQGNGPTDTGRTMLCQNVVNAASAGGDSGSPVFDFEPFPNVDPVPVRIHGILWGGSGQQFTFSPISQVVAEMPLLKFFATENPSSFHEVKIRQPFNNTVVKVGGVGAVSFMADAVDYEDKNLVLTWSSSIEGFMGNGPKLDYSFKTPGIHKVKVVAEDDQGGQLSHEIIVAVINSSPTPKIISPQQDQTLYKNITYNFQGEYSDPDESLPVDGCSKLSWSAKKVGEQLGFTLGKGCTIPVKFQNVGEYYIYLSAIDTFGAVSTTTRKVKVVDGPATGAPLVTILSPQVGALLPKLAATALKGVASDPDNAGPMFYKWEVQEFGVWIEIANGKTLSGQPFSVNWTPAQSLNGGCGTQKRYLRLRVTDAGGQMGQAVQEIYIAFPNC